MESKYSAETKKVALELLSSGKSYPSAAKESGVNISTLRVWAKGTIPPRNTHEIDEDELESLKQRTVQLYSEDYSLDEVAEQVGRSQATVIKWLKQAEVPRRKVGDLSLALIVKMTPELEAIPPEGRRKFCLEAIANALKK